MRIVTRPDFDGIVCAVLLYEALDIRQTVKWVEPNALQRGLVDIRKGDIIANLPYEDRCSLWFDHHYTNQIYRSFQGVFKIAPSAAGIIFEHFKDRFNRDYTELVTATDKIDAADLSLDEVLYPERHGYVMLSMSVINVGVSDEPYWNKLIDLLRNNDISVVLDDPEVKERCRRVIEDNEKYSVYLNKYTRLDNHVSITDFRNFPDSVVNMRIRYEKRNREMTAVNIGHSIFNRHCNVNAGLLLADFGGGGHRGAASTRFESSKADDYLPRIIDVLQKNENNELG
jgi:nanoRNase/pAp phosphatase (c-di-AMP/oligoRNAs hydrolase)